MIGGGGALIQLLIGYGASDIYIHGNPEDGFAMYENIAFNRSPTNPSLEFTYLEKNKDKGDHNDKRFNPDATISPDVYFKGIEDSFHTLTREYNKFKSINEVEKERKCTKYEFTNEVDIHEKIHIIERPDNEKTLPVVIPERPDYKPKDYTGIRNYR